MQGVSRGSLATVRDKLDSVLSGSKLDAAAKQQVGEELFAVVALLDGNAQLRRMLSDPAVDADRRERLAADLYASRLSAPSSEVVTSLVRGQWGKPKDLVDATDELAVQALFAMAEQADVLDEVEDELFRFGRIVEANADLRAALADPALPDENKVALVNALVEDKARPITVRLLTQVATNPRGHSPEDAIADYTAIASRRRARLVARVTTAIGLSDSEITRLHEALTGLYGREVHLQIEVDADIVGGVVVQVGDEVLDGSVAGRLADARRRLG
jgi:F-type H+-transporting ATPase subunit delta